MKYLFLDDDKQRQKTFVQMAIGHTVTQAWTADEAIEALQKDSFDIVFLDHDLDGEIFVNSFGEKPTGYTVAKWIANNRQLVNIGYIVVHSFNLAGAKNMCNVLTPTGIRVEMAPYGTFTLKGAPSR